MKGQLGAVAVVQGSQKRRESESGTCARDRSRYIKRTEPRSLKKLKKNKNYISNLWDFAVVDVNGLRASSQSAAQIALKRKKINRGERAKCALLKRFA
jgi:PP-loop superfamily ATP-utilizing enzyme